MLDFLSPSVDVAPWAADYNPSADPYNYGSPGNNWYSGPTGGSATGGGLLSGFGDTLLGLAQVYGGIEKAKVQASQPLYQVGPNGQLYREGVPIGAYGGGSIGGISPLLLILLIGGAFMLAND